jgi:T3SS negative regulator,GrlR
MVEGFWIVQYEGMRGNGGGVVMFIKGQVFGGDTGYIYTGTYEVTEDAVKAHIMVSNFLPDIPSVLGVVGDFELLLDAKVRGNIIEGTGKLANGEAVGIAVKLTKRADLPS